MDDIVRRCAKKHLKDKSNRDFVNNSIKKTYGFDYHQHFRKMLMQVIGLATIENIENTIDPIKFQIMVAALSALKPYRDREAHTYIKGTTRKLDAPSITESRFWNIYYGLKDFDENVQRL